MDEELQGFHKQNVISPIKDSPANPKIIESKWVFDIKVKVDGTIDKYKARLVAKGYKQIQGVHYFDKTAPVAKLNSVKLLLSITAINQLELHQMDVKQAFLIPKLKEELYIRMPDGKVCKLNKTIYGLKQSAYEWNNEVVKHFEFGKSFKFLFHGFFPMVPFRTLSKSNVEDIRMDYSSDFNFRCFGQAETFWQTEYFRYGHFGQFC